MKKTIRATIEIEGDETWCKKFKEVLGEHIEDLGESIKVNVIEVKVR